MSRGDEARAVAPKRIWLHGIGSHHGDVTWCDDPNPSNDPDELEEAVEYVRADLAVSQPTGEMPGREDEADEIDLILRAAFDAAYERMRAVMSEALIERGGRKFRVRRKSKALELCKDALEQASADMVFSRSTAAMVHEAHDAAMVELDAAAAILALLTPTPSATGEAGNE